MFSLKGGAKGATDGVNLFGLERNELGGAASGVLLATRFGELLSGGRWSQGRGVELNEPLLFLKDFPIQGGRGKSIKISVGANRAYGIFLRIA